MPVTIIGIAISQQNAIDRLELTHSLVIITGFIFVFEAWLTTTVQLLQECDAGLRQRRAGRLILIVRLSSLRRQSPHNSISTSAQTHSSKAWRLKLPK
jgi:hypothetical protein